MSMLAERKQKQRWSLNPRGKHWSEDVNKFGHKMLEKMGWSAGKGLGTNEDGIKEHVKVSYKNDAKGMGFKDNSDQWTKHEDNFTSLLAKLGSGSDAKQITLPKPEKSLEKKSQSSRARVHYHKFTRGKDLATRSEKDIANIFGRKTLERPVAPKETPEDSVENGNEEKSFGVVTVKAGNMAEYFKSKMGKFGNFSSSKGDYELNDQDEYESSACAGFGFSSVNENSEKNDETSFSGKKTSNFVSSQNGNTEEATSEMETKNNKRKRSDSEDWTEVVSKKKKKSKKNQMAFDNLGSNINPAEEVCYDNPCLNQTDSPPKNEKNDEKSKKKKRVTFSSPIIELLNLSDEKTVKSKKKKNKQQKNGIDNLGCEDNSFEEFAQLSDAEKSKKKKKRKLNNSENSGNVTLTKKKRKHAEVGIDNLACEEISVNEKNEEIKRYKLKKKAMEHGLVNPACEANNNSPIQDQSPKKKNKKSKENILDNLDCEENSILKDTEVQKKKKKKQKKKSQNSCVLSNENISDVSQNDSEAKTKTKKNKNKKQNAEKNLESSPKKLKKKSKSNESGIENLGCEINIVEENIASMNSEIDNYQTELENEINVKKVKKSKKGQKQNESNKKSKGNTIASNQQNTNSKKNFQQQSKFSHKSGQETINNKFNKNGQNRFNGQRTPNNFNRPFNGQRETNNFNRSFNDQQRPNHFNRSFNDQQRPNHFNRSFNDQQRPNNFNRPQRFNPNKVDKSSVKHLLAPGQLKLSFTGSNIMKFVGYGVTPELITQKVRPEPDPNIEKS